MRLAAGVGLGVFMAVGDEFQTAGLDRTTLSSTGFTNAVQGWPGIAPPPAAVGLALLSGTSGSQITGNGLVLGGLTVTKTEIAGIYMRANTILHHVLRDLARQHLSPREGMMHTPKTHKHADAVFALVPARPD